MKRVRNFCVTYNNYDSDTLKKFESLECVKYAVFGKEVGSSGTPHLQGYVQLRDAKTISAFQKVLKKQDLKCSILMAKGNWEQNVNYCSKDKDVVTWGQPKKQGRRTDLESMYDDIKAGKDDLYLQENHTSNYIRYYKAVDRIRKNLEKVESLACLEKRTANVSLTGWQIEANTRLETQGDRYIDWYWEPHGKHGKTQMALKLLAQGDTAYFDMSNRRDVSYSYSREKTVIFDFPKSYETDKVDYTLIESFKNGALFSGKYESGLKIFNPARVIVFSNWEPNLNRLSLDRFRIFNIE